MKKVKIILALFILMGIILSPIEKVNAHSVELDPESLISMPMMIIGGSGTITIKNSVSNYTLYFQGVEISSTLNSQIKETEANGKKDLGILKEAYTKLKTEVDNLKTTLDKALEEYQTGINNNVSETELKKLKTAYETAKSNYQTKATEYSNKVKEYNNKVNEINAKIKELTPTYIESNWIQAKDNKISVDVNKFSGKRAYAIWVKLVTSSATYYDEAIYEMTGNKEPDVSVKSVTLDKTTLSISEGSNYTLTATITPSDATNKSLVWKSDNEKVATVSNGKVNGVSEGTATITVTTKDGNYSATCKVIVTKKTITDNTDKETTDTDTTGKPEDTTVATGKLPQTGVNMTIAIASIIGISLIAIIIYKNYNNYKDIK